jgi:glutamate racemase
MSRIGIFDSGLGGLTVLKQFLKHLPNNEYIYFGDNARVPYGNKSKKMVEHYSVQAVRFLKSKSVDLIVVACNTASANALESIQKEAGEIKVIDMISPSILHVQNLGLKSIGLIGTESTIDSGAYQSKLIGKSIQVKTQACPLFVPFVEAGLTDHSALEIIIKEYLENLTQIDGLILGCTHYPLLSKSIKNHINEVKIIDTGEAAAFYANSLNIPKSKSPNMEFYVSDKPNKFIKIAIEKLDLQIDNIQEIDIETY